MIRLQGSIIHRSKNTIVSNKRSDLTENPDLEADFLSPLRKTFAISCAIYFSPLPFYFPLAS
jgi:hypothetical protein